LAKTIAFADSEGVFGAVAEALKLEIDNKHNQLFHHNTHLHSQNHLLFLSF